MILDASWSTAVRRGRPRQLADATASELHSFVCAVAPEHRRLRVPRRVPERATTRRTRRPRSRPRCAPGSSRGPKRPSSTRPARSSALVEQRARAARPRRLRARRHPPLDAGAVRLDAVDGRAPAEHAGALVEVRHAVPALALERRRHPTPSSSTTSTISSPAEIVTFALVAARRAARRSRAPRAAPRRGCR